jgi:hypothetical protein
MLNFTADCNSGRGEYGFNVVTLVSLQARIEPMNLMECDLDSLNDGIIIEKSALGELATPEQRASYHAQLGLDMSAWRWYLDWLIGSEARAENLIGYDLVTIANQSSGKQEWWANVDGSLTRWRMEDGRLLALQRMPDGPLIEITDNDWQQDETGREYFWGVDTNNNAVMWVKNQGAVVWRLTKAGLRKEGDGPQQYIPLHKGILHGDETAEYQLRDDGQTLVVIAPNRGELILTQYQP